jgi:carbon monoxide dehydrogenase subunit G
MRTSSVTRSVDIDASVEQVFALVSDPAKAMAAMDTLGRVAVSDVVTTPAGAVTSWKWSEHFRLLPFRIHATVTRQEHVPDQRIVEKHSTGPVCIYTVEPSGHGTRLTYTAELARPLALMTKVQAFVTTKGKGMQRDMDTFLGEIKRQLEA